MTAGATVKLPLVELFQEGEPFDDEALVPAFALGDQLAEVHFQRGARPLLLIFAMPIHQQIGG